MDALNAGESSAKPELGGAVEPMKPKATGKPRLQASQSALSERYELRDPYSDTTFRSSSLEKVIEKAEKLGSSRFSAIAEDGRRTLVSQSGGEWHRGKQLAALPERPLDSTNDEPSSSVGRQESTLLPSDAQRHRAQAKPPSPAAERVRSEGEGQIDRAAYIAKLEAGLHERYIIKKAPATIGPISVGHTEYRFRGDTSRIAFTESHLRLATDTNSPSVARSMIDVALARSWNGLRVSGSEDFRRMVWLEASVRGVKALGYEPNPADFDVLKREREARQTNRVQPTAEANTQKDKDPRDKGSSRGGGGRKAVVAAIEAILRERGVPEAKRNAVLGAANEQLALRARNGLVPKIRVYDPAASSQRPSPAPIREPSRSRDRATPAQSR